MQNRSTLADLMNSLGLIAPANGDLTLAYLIEMAEVHVLEQGAALSECPDQNDVGPEVSR